MLSTDQVKLQMKEIQKKELVTKKDVARFRFLGEALKYLESEPRQEFVEHQLSEIEKKITTYKTLRIPIDQMLKDNRKKLLKQLNEDSNITGLRRQRTMLIFLLNKEGELINSNAPA